MNLYSIFDRESGIHSMPLMFDNDAVAKRYFPYVVQTNERFQLFSKDMSLYRLGSFDERTGQICPEQHAEFIMNYTDVPQPGKESQNE